jgi:hypothetical protein
MRDDKKPGEVVRETDVQWVDPSSTLSTGMVEAIAIPKS